MKRKTLCNNGNIVERFCDRKTRSSVTRVIDKDGNQVGNAAYDGNKVSADFAAQCLILECCSVATERTAKELRGLK